MFDHPLLIVGCVLLSASIVLAFVGRPQSIVIAMVLLGVVCCLIGVPDVQDFVFEFWGGKATVHMKQIKEGANDIAAQLGTINQKIQSLSNDITKQEEFNSAINSRIVQIDGKMNTSGSLPNPNIASVSPTVCYQQQIYSTNLL